MIPVSAQQRLNMVPVDYVADLVVKAALDPRAAGKTFHATLPATHQPQVGELITFVRAWAQSELGYDPGYTPCLSIPYTEELGRRRNLAASSTAKPKSFLQNMLALAPYFMEDRTYGTENVEELFGANYPQWREYLPRLLAYAVRMGFLNHSERTVFEQMMVRMASNRTSLDYFDVSRDGIVKTSATQAKAEIEQAASALLAMGVTPGDRVALVGFNSTRYFMADAAVGLVGATSVPLY